MEEKRPDIPLSIARSKESFTEFLANYVDSEHTDRTKDNFWENLGEILSEGITSYLNGEEEAMPSWGVRSGNTLVY